jgi:hypothetical protein
VRSSVFSNGRSFAKLSMRRTRSTKDVSAQRAASTVNHGDVGDGEAAEEKTASRKLRLEVAEHLRDVLAEGPLDHGRVRLLTPDERPDRDLV